MTEYSNTSLDELLAALARAGRAPEPSVIAACLERGDELVPGLLDLFRTELEEYEDLDCLPTTRAGTPRSAPGAC